MIINSLELTNFKNFRGLHTLDFSLRNGGNNGKNIVLIGGMNGAGKTTVLEAIKLCLYGKKSDLMGSDFRTYDKLILSKVNSSELKKRSASCSLKLDMYVDNSVTPMNVLVNRSWSIERGKKVKEDLTLTVDGKPLEIVPEEMWQDYLCSVIPLHASSFFFFDGERIKEFASGADSQSVFQESVLDLLNIRKYDNLRKDLEGLIRRIKRRNVKDKKIRRMLDEKQQDMKENEKGLDSLEGTLAELLRNIDELQKDSENIEDEIRRKSGENATRFDEYQMQRSILETDFSTSDAMIKNLSEKYLPFVVASKQCKKLISQLQAERDIRRFDSAKKIIMDLKKEFTPKLRKSKELSKRLSKDEMRLVEREFESVLVSFQNKMMTKTRRSIIHDIADSESHRIETFLEKVNKNVLKELRKTLKNREQIKMALDEIIEKTRSISKQTIDSEMAMLAEKRAEIQTLKQQKLSIDEKRTSIEHVVEEIDSEIRELEEKIVCVDEDAKKIEVCEQLLLVIDEFKSTVAISKSDNLEKEIRTAFRKLSGKKGPKRKIKVDPTSFSIDITHHNDVELNKGDMSAGEQEIYAISVLWGLARASGHAIPMVIDTPLAKLDSKHVDNTVTKFFPSASHQLILLSQDREIDQKLYGKLSKWIDHSLTIAMGEEDKVQEGYFFD